MIHYPFNRAFTLLQNVTLGELTISGKHIIAKFFEDAEKEEFHESYPLRHELALMNRSVVASLKRNNRSTSEIIYAANTLKESFWWALDGIKASYDDEELSDELIEDYNTGSTAPEKKNQNLRHWEIYSNPLNILEVLPDNWLNTVDLWGTKETCTWKEVYAVMTLLSVDESVDYISNGVPYKASSWAIRAGLFIELSGLRFQDEKNSPLSAYSIEAADVRHAQNRAMKKKGIDLYLEKKWSSRAEAARRISPQVNRTQDVVERWIREYHKKVPLPAE